MRFILNGGSIHSREALHQALAAGLHLPEWYGGNLDALHDCLSQPGIENTLVIRSGAALKAALGGYAAAFRRVLADCAAENPQFSVVWDEDTP